MVQVVRVVRRIGLDDMHSENIWFSGSKPSNYRRKLRCHARDRRTDGGGKWKIVQYSELNQKPQFQTRNMNHASSPINVFFGL